SRAWALFDPRADWHLVIQDDVRVVPDLLARTAALLDGLEHCGPVSLYIGRGRPRQAAVGRAVAAAVGGWVTMPWLLWGPAFALPTAQIPRMLAACRVGSREYDRRISNYFERQHIPTLYTLPCLVDHRDEGSLLGHDRGVERRAWEWAGESPRACRKEVRGWLATGLHRPRSGDAATSTPSRPTPSRLRLVRAFRLLGFRARRSTGSQPSIGTRHGRQLPRLRPS